MTKIYRSSDKRLRDQIGRLFGYTFNYRSVSGSTTVLASDHFIATDTAGTFTLLSAAGVAGRSFVFKNNSTGTLVLTADGSELIDGSASISLTVQYESVTLFSDGVGWSIT